MSGVHRRLPCVAVIWLLPAIIMHSNDSATGLIQLNNWSIRSVAAAVPVAEGVTHLNVISSRAYTILECTHNILFLRMQQWCSSTPMASRKNAPFREFPGADPILPLPSLPRLRHVVGSLGWAREQTDDSMLVLTHCFVASNKLF